MKKSTRVKALSIKGRRTFVLRWKDPVTGKWRDQTTDLPATERNRGRAAKLAAEKEVELSGQREEYTWVEFVERYEAEWLAGKRPGTKVAWETAIACLVAFQRNPAPQEIDADSLHRWAAWMRRKGYAEATIQSYLGTLRAGLNWAADVGIIQSPPRFPRIRGAAKMGGRPITTEEFERMLDSVPKVHPRNAEDWRTLLRGMWLSGLRVSEAVALSWDWGSSFAADLDAACFAIRRQKSGKAEYAPMTPDFADFLHSRSGQRSGLVFGISITSRQASRIISAVGKRAGVVTSDDGRHATAHDLRRSFGSRWAEKVHPAELQKLMRHADIATTMKYYVRLDGAALARKIAMGEKTGEKPLATAHPRSRSQST